VPLTSSLYVPGRISDPEHVVIDIGTGYYVKKVSLPSPLSSLPHTANSHPQSRKDAIEYYADKVTYVQKNLEKLQETIERKQDNLQSCVSVMQMKLQEERQAEQGQVAQ
jgi:prefoldin alpha subunit